MAYIVQNTQNYVTASPTETVMQSMLQLNPPLPVDTPHGKALAHILIDYGPEEHLLWVCFQDNGEIWAWPNPKVRAQNNPSMGRVLCQSSGSNLTSMDGGKRD